MARTSRYHIGQTFGDSLTLLAPVRSPNHSTLSWDCRCLKCGHEFEASYAMLRKAEDSDYPLCPACTERRPRRTKHKPFEKGQRVGFLTMLEREYVTTSGRKAAYWRVECDCGGAVKRVREQHLQTGATKSCGCSPGRSNFTP